VHSVPGISVLWGIQNSAPQAGSTFDGEHGPGNPTTESGDVILHHDIGHDVTYPRRIKMRAVEMKSWLVSTAELCVCIESGWVGTVVESGRRISTVEN
jgi:hypothetical protein